MSDRYYLKINYNWEEGYSCSFMSEYYTSNKKKCRTFWYVEDIERWVAIIKNSWTLVFASFESYYGDPNFTLIFATDTQQQLADTQIDWVDLYDHFVKEFTDNGLKHQISKVEDILEYTKCFDFTHKDLVAMLLSYFKEMEDFASIFGEVANFFGTDKISFDGITLEQQDTTLLSNIAQDYQTFLLSNR